MVELENKLDEMRDDELAYRKAQRERDRVLDERVDKLASASGELIRATANPITRRLITLFPSQNSERTAYYVRGSESAVRVFSSLLGVTRGNGQQFAHLATECY